MTREALMRDRRLTEPEFGFCLRQIRESLDAAVAAFDRGDEMSVDDVLAARLMVSTLLVKLESD